MLFLVLPVILEECVKVIKVIQCLQYHPPDATEAESALHLCSLLFI